MNHSRTFTHSSHFRLFPSNFNFQANLLNKGVSSHNRSSRINSAIFRQIFHNFFNPILDFFHIKLNPNNSSRLNQNFLSTQSQFIRNQLSHLFSIRKSSISCARICISTIYYNRLCILIFYMLNIQNNWCSLCQIFCKNRS